MRDEEGAFEKRNSKGKVRNRVRVDLCATFCPSAARLGSRTGVRDEERAFEKRNSKNIVRNRVRVDLCATFCPSAAH